MSRVKIEEFLSASITSMNICLDHHHKGWSNMVSNTVNSSWKLFSISMTHIFSNFSKNYFYIERNLHVAFTNPSFRYNFFFRFSLHTNTFQFFFFSIVVSLSLSVRMGAKENNKTLPEYTFSNPRESQKIPLLCICIYFLLLMYKTIFFWWNKRQLHQWRKGEGEGTKFFFLSHFLTVLCCVHLCYK